MIPDLLPLLQTLTESLQQRPVVAIATLFGAGVLTSFTPCIYPMIPITAGILSGSGRENQSRARTLGLTPIGKATPAMSQAARSCLVGQG